MPHHILTLVVIYFAALILQSKLSGDKDVENKRKKQAMKLLVERIWEKIVLLEESEILELIMKPRPLIFDAAKQGNFEFLTILIREYPDLVWKVDEKFCSIFHYAVSERHEDVFKLIYEIGAIKDIIVLSQEKETGNNILHLAGKLAPQDRLNIVSGAALQMQRELLWFRVKYLIHSTMHIHQLFYDYKVFIFSLF